MPPFQYVPCLFLKSSLVCLTRFSTNCLHIHFISLDYRWRDHTSSCSSPGFLCVRSPFCRIIFCTKSVSCMDRITESGLSRTPAPMLCWPTPPVRCPTRLNWCWLPHCCTLFPGAWRIRRKYVWLLRLLSYIKTIDKIRKKELINLRNLVFKIKNPLIIWKITFR